MVVKEGINLLPFSQSDALWSNAIPTGFMGWKLTGFMVVLDHAGPNTDLNMGNSIPNPTISIGLS